MTKALRIAAMLFLACAYGITAFGQVPVAVGPQPKTQFLDNGGVPLEGGLVCTYAAGTSTPQATYTDSTGTVQNANPVVLDSAGRANIWWTASAYKVVLAGGGTCASPSNLQWTVDNFSIGVFAAGNTTFSGNNIFNGTTVMNGAVTIANGGTFNGTFAGSPNFSGSVTFSGSLSVSQLSLTVATGTPPLVVTSTTLVSNLNVQLVNGVSFPASPSLHSAPVITSSNVATWKVIPDCQNGSGVLNFTQSTNVFGCGTANPGAVNCPASKAGFALTYTGGTWSCTEIVPPVYKKGTNAGAYTCASCTITNVDGTNLGYTVTIPTGSNLVIRAAGSAAASGATSATIAISDGGTPVVESQLGWSAGATPGTFNFSLDTVIAGDGLSHVITLQWLANATITMNNSSGIFPTMLFTLQ